ncbi:MAG: Nramp family divalent metal transporter [Erysipelotrichaceae bacterium]|nr:Nramp family divalent metal transporter [Erysipelotrichaceae bacterium]
MKEIIKKRWAKISYILAIVGPGLITVNAGNDAGGISTFASIGAKYGYSMLWGLLLLTFALAIIQEMNARMAVVSGKGLSDLIREKFGVKWTFFAMIVLLVANFGVTLGDFAGVAASLELFGITKYISVPVVAILISYLVSHGSYNKVEKIFLMFSFAFFSYIFSAIIIKPDWPEVFKAVVSPSIEMNSAYLLTFIGLIGTTISPYMQFYLQAAIVDKNLSLKDYKYERLDVYLGAVWGAVISFFVIVVTAATLHKAGIQADSVSSIALALKPLAGDYAFILFGAGLFGASVLACAIIPLSTAYAICEAFGWENGVNNTPSEAKAFFTILFGIIGITASLVLIPNLNLIPLILRTQQIAGILVPVILIFMILLINDRNIMGTMVNNKFQNIISTLTVIFIISLTTTLFVTQIVSIFS